MKTNPRRWSKESLQSLGEQCSRLENLRAYLFLHFGNTQLTNLIGGCFMLIGMIKRSPCSTLYQFIASRQLKMSLETLDATLSNCGSRMSICKTICLKQCQPTLRILWVWLKGMEKRKFKASVSSESRQSLPKLLEYGAFGKRRGPNANYLWCKRCCNGQGQREIHKGDIGSKASFQLLCFKFRRGSLWFWLPSEAESEHGSWKVNLGRDTSDTRDWSVSSILTTTKGGIIIWVRERREWRGERVLIAI